MSKNFEVLSRIGHDGGASPSDTTSAFDVTVVLDEKQLKPNPKSNYNLRPEILRLVQVLFLASQNSPHCVLFCGVDETDGSAGVCTSVARGLAEEVSQKVCLMDASIPGSHLEESANVNDSGCDSGDLIRPFDGAMRRIGDNLWFYSTKKASSARIIKGGTVDLCSALLRLRQEFDYVLVHTAPAGTDRVASVLGQVADGVVLVLEANSTRRVTARNAKEALEAAKVRLIGTVLNNRTFPIPEKLYRSL